MDNDIIFYHKLLQKNIHIVEKDNGNEDALIAVKEAFLKVYNMIKMIMISKQERYYGCFLMNLDLQINFYTYSSAAVYINSYPFILRVNPLILGLHSLQEIIYIICHEIEHIVLNHPAEDARYNPADDPAINSKLNMAMDASINDRLTMDSKIRGFTVISEPREAITSHWLRDYYSIHIKELQAFDYYYERIPDKKGKPGDGYIIIVRGDPKSREIITAPKLKNALVLHNWTDCDNPEEISSLIRKFVSEVYDMMPESMRSNLPDYQNEAIQQLLAQPTVSWKQILKKYVGTIPDGQRKTRTRLSRRQPERYDISGQISNRILKLIVAIDTSGSMGAETLKRIFVEIFAIVGTRMCEVTVIECDAAIQRIYKARSIKDISYDIHGRGGTSYVPVIEYINENRHLRDAILIYFTDGEGNSSIPKPLTFRTMWVLHNEKCKLSVIEPYGEVLVMD